MCKQNTHTYIKVKGNKVFLNKQIIYVLQLTFHCVLNKCEDFLPNQEGKTPNPFSLLPPTSPHPCHVCVLGNYQALNLVSNFIKVSRPKLQGKNSVSQGVTEH